MEVEKEYLRKALTSNPISIFNKMMRTDSGKIAWMRTKYVLRISLSIYIPLIILCIMLFIKYNYMALLIWLLTIISAFPFAKYIMIPLSENKKNDIRNYIKNSK